MDFEYFMIVVKEIEPFRENNGTKNLNGYKMPNNYILGDCGKQYGWLWRNWENHIWIEHGQYYAVTELDQIKNLIEGLKSNPMGRRHIITAWNPATLDDMALNACHSFVQFNVRPIYHKYNPKVIANYYLDCQLYQRSADMFLGVPFNIASYALLTNIIAKICNMVPGEFIHTFGDSHIYDNHIDQVKEILTRDPEKYELPKLIIEDDCIDIDSLKIDMFGLKNYQSYPAIKAKLSTGLK